MKARVVLSACLVLGLCACSTLEAPRSAAKPLTEPAGAASWQGRLSVAVHSDPQRLSSASFHLSGSAQKGELSLFSPMGTTLAQLQWSGSEAYLQQGQGAQRYASVSELTEQVTGSVLPVAALFDWLQGREHPTAGWQVDLSGMSQGLLNAQRTQPLPTVSLRIKLEP